MSEKQNICECGHKKKDHVLKEGECRHVNCPCKKFKAKSNDSYTNGNSKNHSPQSVKNSLIPKQKLQPGGTSTLSDKIEEIRSRFDKKEDTTKLWVIDELKEKFKEAIKRLKDEINIYKKMSKRTALRLIDKIMGEDLR